MPVAMVMAEEIRTEAVWSQYKYFCFLQAKRAVLVVLIVGTIITLLKHRDASIYMHSLNQLGYMHVAILEI